MLKKGKLVKLYDILNAIVGFKAYSIMNNGKDSKERNRKLEHIKNLLFEYVNEINSGKISVPHLQRFLILWDSFKLLADTKIYLPVRVELIKLFERSFNFQLEFYSRSSFSSFFYFLSKFKAMDNSFELDDYLKSRAILIVKKQGIENYEKNLINLMKLKMNSFGSSFLELELHRLSHHHIKIKNTSLLKKLNMLRKRFVEEELKSFSHKFSPIPHSTLNNKEKLLDFSIRVK